MISNIKGVLHRVNPLVAAVALVLAALVPVLSARQVSALPLTDRSLMVSSTVPSNDNVAPDGTTYVFGNGAGQIPAGDPRNGTKVDHTYTFTVPTAGDIEGFTIEYCESAFGYVGAGACTATNLLDNTGFSAAAWDEATIQIEGIDFNVVADDAPNFITLVADNDPLTVTAGQQIEIAFEANETNFFRNPNSSYLAFNSGTYFAHISTFDDATNAGNAFSDVDPTPDGVIDDGTVTNNITQAISIYTRVQETLNFSVEGDYNNGVPDGPSSAYAGSGACTPLNANDNLIRLGDGNNALSPSQAYFGRSYFRLATNAFQGTTVYYAGDTLRYGTNTIDAIGGGAAVASTPGTEQFGFAFNPTDATGNMGTTTNIIGDDGTLVPSAVYADNATGYAFDDGSLATPVPLAAVEDDVVECDTGSLEYVANISTSTPAGIYTTKINFIAAPTY